MVNTDSERGLVAITSLDVDDGEGTASKEVFLYFTAGDPLRNRVYKYHWNGQTLVNPELILDLPATPADDFNGGRLVVGPDGYLYTVIGDVRYSNYGQLQNIPTVCDIDTDFVSTTNTSIS